MIKGCSRKVIVIKNPGSDLFEEAYFIVSPREAERQYGDFLTEANRIIALRTTPHVCAQRSGKKFVPWIFGFFLGATVAFPLYFLIF